MPRLADPARPFIAAEVALALIAAAPVPPAATPAVATSPAAAPVPVELTKDYAKDLGKGRMLDTLEAKGTFAKLTPPEVLLKSYAAASVGAPVAAELLHGTEFVTAPEAQALCQGIVDRLLAGWKGPKPNVTVRITADPAFHGEGKDGDLLEIGLGTFNRDPVFGAVSIDELALLIGHELGHILLGHNESRRTVEHLASALSVAASGYMAYGLVGKSHMIGNQLQVARDPALVRQGLIGGLASQTLIVDLLTPSFGRAKELDADKIGIDLARRAGYDVTAQTAKEFFHHQLGDPAKQSARINALGVVLHIVMAQAAQRMGQKAGGNMAGLTAQLTMLVGNQAVDLALKWVAKRNKDHPDPDQRTEFAREYLANNYPPAADTGGGVQLKKRDNSLGAVATAQPTITLLGHVKSSDDVKKGIIEAPLTDPAAQTASFAQLMQQANLNTPAVSAAAVAPGKGKLGKGRRATTVAAGTKVERGFADDNAVGTWRVQGLLQFADGGTDAARQSWQHGLRSDFAATDTAFHWAVTLTPEQQAAQLPSVIDQFTKVYGSADVVLDLSVALAIAQGNTAVAETTAARCVTFDNGRLYPNCVVFLGYDPMDKTTPAQTPEGQRAFAGKSLEKSFGWLRSIGEIF